MSGTSTATIITFLAYIAGVFLLAGFSHRLLAKKSFMGEYFLGSRGLGSWALAFTFAATSSSGGSFTGYPSLIYSHGWVLALWIASYMVVPVCTMGVMGKRLNSVARKTGAITIPDVLRDRFESTSLAMIATCTIIFFTTCNLVAQFKAGALIIEETFNLPATWGYVGGLLIFSFTVIFYTAYGGFRAVVWTDVMQGVMMGIGTIILVPVVLSQAGGLEEVNEKIRAKPPTVITSVRGAYNDLAIEAVGQPRPDGMIYSHPNEPNRPLQVHWDPGSAVENADWIEVELETDKEGTVISTGNEVKAALESHPQLGDALKIGFAFENNQYLEQDGEFVGATGAIEIKPDSPAKYAFVRGDEALFGPGRTASGTPFHPLGMAISFFFMWAISGMGQPGTMVRLMAFRESRTLKRAIMTVTVYYSLIYLPMVFVFVAARTLLPHISEENSDKAMVLVATRVVADMGLGYQILAAIFIAAPFAAVMSTVDSFLLMISSALVRDVYQRTINPDVREKVVKWASYTTTAIVGALVTMVAMDPPDFLQYIIVFTGGGFASTFLAPVLLAIYWKGMTRQGALASMIGGFTIVVSLFTAGMVLEYLEVWEKSERINLMGFHPVFWGLFGSVTLAIVVSKLTGPPPQHLVQKYFYKQVRE